MIKWNDAWYTSGTTTANLWWNCNTTEELPEGYLPHIRQPEEDQLAELAQRVKVLEEKLAVLETAIGPVNADEFL